uniref:Cyclin n=2 Tax=Podospora anserina (strain S / ATCC MYA-4624 / DSM 980 / FGSC 10383) TaxID=515849 RepID=A0A090CJH6_PODAN|nr:Putative cyclin [Podospora anserina S mat+]
MATEDARYRDSSQYRLWSFSPTQLSALREKTNAAARARISERLLSHPLPVSTSKQDLSAPTSNANTPDPDGNSTPALPEFLTPAEELTLVGYYTSEILRASEALHYADEIKATAAMFLKRFYITNSIMTYPPAEMFFVALFFACKVDTGHVNLAEYTKIFNKSAEEILAGEFLLCQGLRFAFDVKHPYRALRGAMMELASLPDMQKDLKRLDEAEAKARKVLQFSPLMTDAYFHYTPSQIMLAALSLADRGLAERLIQETFHFVAAEGNDTPGGGGGDNNKGNEEKARVIGSQIRDKVLGAIEGCRDMLSRELPERKDHWLNKQVIKTQITPLRKKLLKCKDPERWNLVELQRVRREQAAKKMDSDDEDDLGGGKKVKKEEDGDIFGGDLGHSAKKRKMTVKKEEDPFGGPMVKKEDPFGGPMVKKEEPFGGTKVKKEEDSSFGRFGGAL